MTIFLNLSLYPFFTEARCTAGLFCEKEREKIAKNLHKKKISRTFATHLRKARFSGV